MTKSIPFANPVLSLLQRPNFLNLELMAFLWITPGITYTLFKATGPEKFSVQDAYNSEIICPLCLLRTKPPKTIPR